MSHQQNKCVEEDKGGHVVPKRNCPHVNHSVKQLPLELAVRSLESPCASCGDTSENWFCLFCHQTFCGRYVQGHMLQHLQDTNNAHLCVLSLTDLNTWCYGCESYIISPSISSSYEAFYLAKFGTSPTDPMLGSQDPGLGEEECEETIEEVMKKSVEIAELIKKSKHIVVFTGAGISTSANIPDFRGPSGVWTKRAKGDKDQTSLQLETIQPTLCHKAIVALLQHKEKEGKTVYVISQNTDGLHRKSGIPSANISELHGNAFIEVCWECGKDYPRDYNTTTRSGRRSPCEDCLRRVPVNCHCTLNKCDCGHTLKDSIIAFGENLPEKQLKSAVDNSKAADLCIVLGSSLVVSPANSLPRETTSRGGKLVIVNLQRTPLDRRAHLRIYGRTDQVMQVVMQHLQIAIPE